MHKLVTVAAIAATLASTSCSNNDEPGAMTLTPKKTILLTPQEEVVKDYANQFSFYLWDSYRQTPQFDDECNDNLAMSPYGVFINLSTVANGARGESYGQIMQLLCHDKRPEAIDELNRYNRHIMAELRDADASVTFAIDEMLMTDSTRYTIRPEFLETCATYYHMPFIPYSPDDKSGELALHNEYMKWFNSLSYTHKISLPQSQSCTDGVNTLCYLAGTWTSQFAKENTRDDIFNTREGIKKYVPTMHAENMYVRTAETQDASLMALPFGNGQFEMVFVLPDHGHDVWSCMTEEIINPTRCEWMDQRMTEIAIPKFNISSTYAPILPLNIMDFSLLGENSKLIGTSYSGNLSGMFDGEEHGIYPCQYTSISINETGAKAESATLGCDESYPATFDAFRLNRPFLFLMRETSTGAILFMGCINDPGK